MTLRPNHVHADENIRGLAKSGQCSSAFLKVARPRMFGIPKSTESDSPSGWSFWPDRAAAFNMLAMADGVRVLDRSLRWRSLRTSSLFSIRVEQAIRRRWTWMPVLSLMPSEISKRPCGVFLRRYSQRDAGRRKQLRTRRTISASNFCHRPA